MPFTIKPEDAIRVDTDTTGYLKDHVDTGDRWVLNFGPQHPATHTTLRLVLELDGERIDIRAGIHVLGGYSAHADQKNLLDFIGRMRRKPAQVRLVHGDDPAKQALAAALRQRHPGMDVVVAGAAP